MLDKDTATISQLIAASWQLEQIVSDIEDLKDLQYVKHALIETINYLDDCFDFEPGDTYGEQYTRIARQIGEFC